MLMAVVIFVVYVCCYGHLVDLNLFGLLSYAVKAYQPPVASLCIRLLMLLRISHAYCWLR
jgi:hypothetical protein